VTDVRRPSAPRRGARRTAPPSTRPAGYALLLTVVGVLMVVGLVMVLSASSVASVRQYGSTWSVFLKQALWVAVGAAALVVTQRVDYHRWRALSGPLLVLSGALLVLVLLPGIGVRVYGASRWLGFGPLRVQPSELAKLAVLLYSADLLTRRGDRMHDSRLTLRPVMAVTSVLVVLVMRQPDMGTTMVICFLVLAVLFVAGTPLVPLGAVAVAGASASMVLAMGEGYRRARLLAFLDPSADPSNTGYQTLQSLNALGEGGIGGVGLGAGRAKYGFLPNAHTDFIFAVLGEEVGLIGAILVVALFCAFAVLGVRAAVRAPDRFGMLVAAGVTAWVCGQAFVNIGAVIGLLPVTGVPLPFISAGGSSMVVTMAGVGMLLNVARHARER
jgi:cell division protein FtsW